MVFSDSTDDHEPVIGREHAVFCLLSQIEGLCIYRGLRYIRSLEGTFCVGTVDLEDEIDFEVYFEAHLETANEWFCN